jgi:hypothetical protein
MHLKDRRKKQSHLRTVKPIVFSPLINRGKELQWLAGPIESLLNQLSLWLG